MKTANLAIVFTDIKGYTERTSRQTREQNARMLKLHEALLVPVFKAFRGRLVKTIGDAFLVVFESPTNALLCGAAIQDRLWKYNGSALADDRIEVRVAVSQGEVRVERGDVFGEPVNIAARVEGLADAGEVFFTEAVYLAMNKAEVPSELLGPRALKGIPEPVKIYRVPKGAYRLSSGSAAKDEASYPYGGFALAKIPQVQAFSIEQLESSAALLHLAGRARGALKDLSLRSKRSLVAGGGSLLAGLLLFSLIPSGIDGLIESGKLEEARAKIAGLPDGAEQWYWRGRLDEAGADGHPELGRAIVRYRKAAQGGERRALGRLVDLLAAEECLPRERAAQALGEVGDKSVISALKRAAEASPPSQATGGDLLSKLGRVLHTECDVRAASLMAIRRLESK